MGIKLNSNAGRPDHRDLLNRALPAGARAGLGDMLYDLTNAVNAILKRLDQLGTAAVQATVAATVTSSSIVPGDTISLTFTNAAVKGLPVTVGPYTVRAGDTVTTIAAALVALINAHPTLQAADIVATNAAGVITAKHRGTIGNTTVLTRAVVGTVACSIANTGTLSGGAGTLGTDNFNNFNVALPEARS